MREVPWTTHQNYLKCYLKIKDFTSEWGEDPHHIGKEIG